jgi:hypothetical protein
MKRGKAFLGAFAVALMCIGGWAMQAWAYDVDVTNDTNFEIGLVVNYGGSSTFEDNHLASADKASFENDNWSEGGFCWKSLYVFAQEQPDTDGSQKSYNCNGKDLDEIKSTHNLGQCEDIKIKVNMNHDCGFTFDVD